MKDKNKKVGIALYCGLLKVQVLVRLAHCSLIKFGKNELVVDTSDLTFRKEAKAKAA